MKKKKISHYLKETKEEFKDRVRNGFFWFMRKARGTQDKKKYKRPSPGTKYQ